MLTVWIQYKRGTIVPYTFKSNEQAESFIYSIRCMVRAYRAECNGKPVTLNIEKE